MFQFIDYEITSSDYFAGMREALKKFAWWKDGIEYVGCGVYTLKHALAEVDCWEKNWNEKANSAAT